MSPPATATSLHSVRLCGVGLHTGEPCEVTLRAAAGPVRLGRLGRTWPHEELLVAGATLGVSLRDSAHDFELGLVEHFLAALGGLGINQGVVAEVSGPELPLLDGGSAEYCAALTSLGVGRGEPRLVVARAGSVVLGESLYEFQPAEQMEMRVRIDFPEPAIGRQEATWDGDPASFVRDIASARTFGFERDAQALWGKGFARGANAASVIVVRDDGSVHPDSEPLRPQEFAQHKLLDLIGDTQLCGGPVRGRLIATRPGHARSHQAFAAAKRLGLIALRG